MTDGSAHPLLAGFVLVTSLACALPTIVGASVLLFSPGNVDAALGLLVLGQPPAKEAAGEARAREPVVAHTPRADGACTGTPHLGEQPPAVSGGGGGGGDAGLRIEAADANDWSGRGTNEPSATEPATSVKFASSVDAAAAAAAVVDEEEDTNEGWQEAIEGIKGMAQALAEANNSVAVVSLNSDLTVSLSTLMLSTIKLLHPTGAGGDAAAGAADARVMHLADLCDIVRDTCTMAEPLFESGCPLVLYSQLKPGDMCFLPRDTFSCALFALVYRAGTRILRGDCVMTAELSPEKLPPGLVESESTTGAVTAAVAAAGKEQVCYVRVTVEYQTATTVRTLNPTP